MSTDEGRRALIAKARSSFFLMRCRGLSGALEVESKWKGFGRRSGFARLKARDTAPTFLLSDTHHNGGMYEYPPWRNEQN